MFHFSIIYIYLYVLINFFFFDKCGCLGHLSINPTGFEVNVEKTFNGHEGTRT